MSDNDAAHKQELLRLDMLLRRKQAFWETPRAVLLVIAVTAVIAGAAAGFLGFKIGQMPPPPIVIELRTQ